MAASPDSVGLRFALQAATHKDPGGSTRLQPGLAIHEHLHIVGSAKASWAEETFVSAQPGGVELIAGALEPGWLHQHNGVVDRQRPDNADVRLEQVDVGKDQEIALA